MLTQTSLYAIFRKEEDGITFFHCAPVAAFDHNATYILFGEQYGNRIPKLTPVDDDEVKFFYGSIIQIVGEAQLESYYKSLLDDLFMFDNAIEGFEGFPHAEQWVVRFERSKYFEDVDFIL